MTNNETLSKQLRRAIAPVALVVESLQHRDGVADEEDTLTLAVSRLNEIAETLEQVEKLDRALED